MRVVCFDGLTGVAGDMFVGALLDLGVDRDVVLDAISSLGLEGVEISVEKVVRAGVSATKFNVLDSALGVPVEQVKGSRLRGPNELKALIEKAPLPDAVKKHSIGIVMRLARAEAKVHGVAVERVHFHEVGALDTLVDAVAAAAAWCQLGVERASSSAVRVGCGQVKTEHGLLPVPAPATAELLKGVPVTTGGIECELTTPTGAAILREFCTSFGQPEPLEVGGVGYGAGSRDLKVPNVFRAILGETYSGP